MPFFAYKGRNAAGELVRGVIESADSTAVATQLFGTGVTPVEIGATTAPRKAWREPVRRRAAQGRSD